MCCTQGENSLFSLHTSWLMNKYKVISDSNAMTKPRWTKLISPASKRTCIEVRNIKKDAQEIYRISNFLVSIKKIAEISMLPPVAEPGITLSHLE